MLPLMFALLLGAPAPAVPAPPAVPFRMASTAFGQPMAIEVRDLPELVTEEPVS